MVDLGRGPRRAVLAHDVAQREKGGQRARDGRRARDGGRVGAALVGGGDRPAEAAPRAHAERRRVGVEGATTGVPVPDARTGGCATSAGPARGTVRMLQRVSQVRGPGWFVEAGEWQTEEVLEVGDAGACVRSITSGEARDEDEMRANGREEHEPVRSFALRATAAGSYAGTAWSGERAIALRCTVE